MEARIGKAEVDGNGQAWQQKSVAYRRTSAGLWRRFSSMRSARPADVPDRFQTAQ